MLFILEEATYLQTWYHSFVTIHWNRWHPNIPYFLLWAIVLYLYLRCSQNLKIKMKSCCKGLKQIRLENHRRRSYPSFLPPSILQLIYPELRVWVPIVYNLRDRSYCITKESSFYRIKTIIIYCLLSQKQRNS